MTRRLLLSYLSLTLLVLLCLEVPFGYVYARGQMSRFTGNGQQAVVMLAEVLEEKVERRTATDLPELVASFARRTHSHVTVVDSQGKLLTDSRDALPAGTDLSTEPDIAAALRNRSNSGTRLSTKRPSSPPCRAPRAQRSAASYGHPFPSPR
ncbi:hypothetical protein [Streptomyces sioyaensis]|uniref:hypothetical protein n=1 Tax=Streptomyces sioyaensis TaxID=67364 RepID=UPI00371F2C2A